MEYCENCYDYDQERGQQQDAGERLELMSRADTPHAEKSQAARSWEGPPETLESTCQPEQTACDTATRLSTLHKGTSQAHPSKLALNPPPRLFTF